MCEFIHRRDRWCLAVSYFCEHGSETNISCFTHHVSWNVVSFLFSAAVELVCDPPCTGNKICQNYTGVPDCVCADGFSGEDNCTGILNYREPIFFKIYFIVFIFKATLPWDK